MAQAWRPPPVTASVIHSVDEKNDTLGNPIFKVQANDSTPTGAPGTTPNGNLPNGGGGTASPSAASSSPASLVGTTSVSNSLRRIFSPPSSKATGQPMGAAERREQIQQARKRFFTRICACLSPPPSHAQPEPPLDVIFQQIAELEPTYEPTAPLLSPVRSDLAEKICLVLDLDETLVHSSFTPIDGADFEIPLDMQGESHKVYVKKRPGVDQFLAAVAESFEVVVFTASLALYANPVMDLLDPNGIVHGRLYREHCVLVGGFYVKDIGKLGRDLKRTLIVDNSPFSYALQPENAVPIEGFFTDESDRELERVLGLLEKARNLPDVRKYAD